MRHRCVSCRRRHAATHTGRLQDPTPVHIAFQYLSYHYATTFLVTDCFSNIYTILANFIFCPLYRLRTTARNPLANNRNGVATTKKSAPPLRLFNLTTSPRTHNTTHKNTHLQIPPPSTLHPPPSTLHPPWKIHCCCCIRWDLPTGTGRSKRQGATATMAMSAATAMAGQRADEWDGNDMLTTMISLTAIKTTINKKINEGGWMGSSSSPLRRCSGLRSTNNNNGGGGASEDEDLEDNDDRSGG